MVWLNSEASYSVAQYKTQDGENSIEDESRHVKIRDLKKKKKKKKPS